PVILEVSTGAQGAKFEDRFSAVQTPAGARDVHSVFDQVAAGTLDDTGGDGQTGGEVLFVVKVVPVFQQIVGAIVDCGAVTSLHRPQRRATAHARSHVAGVPTQDLQQALTDPALGGGGAFAVQGEAGIPQVFKHVDYIEDDGGLYAVVIGRLLDERQLCWIAVDQGDPALVPGGIATERLLEHLLDDFLGRLGHARPDALVFGPWANDFGGRVPHRSQVGHDVLGLAHKGGDGEHRGHLGHALAVALLAATEPLGHFVVTLCRSFACRLSQTLWPHHDALAVRRQRQDGTGLARLADGVRAAGFVEPVKVHRRARRQLFQLPLGHRGARRRRNGRSSLVEGTL